MFDHGSHLIGEVLVGGGSSSIERSSGIWPQSDLLNIGDSSNIQGWLRVFYDCTSLIFGALSTLKLPDVVVFRLGQRLGQDCHGTAPAGSLPLLSAVWQAAP